MPRTIGIDLGTTNSAVGYLSDDGPHLIPNSLGQHLTPSVVGIDPEGNLVVGQTAKELQVVHPDRCATAFKRNMGTDWTTEIDGRTFTPEELSACILRSLKVDAETHLEESIDRAVITVPAYFNERQRHATMQAGQLAGFQVERILNEPTAAALAYGFHEQDESRLVLVFDLGGGTFDVSIVDQIERVVEVKASSGEIFLGGEDFTRTLASQLLLKDGVSFEHAEVQSPKMVARLLQQCELAKRRLSCDESTALRLPDESGGLHEDSPQHQVTRQDLEQWTRHTLARIETPLRRALGDAHLRRADIGDVIMVGGATRMRSVVARVTELFGKPPLCRLNPDEVVTLGAAVQAGLLEDHQQVRDLVTTDVAPFTLGISTSMRIGGVRQGGFFSPIINRNTTIPVSRDHIYGTIYANQTQMAIDVYQGDHRRVERNLFLGTFKVRGIPRGPAGQPIRVRFTYDLNGVLEVEAEIVETKEKSTHVITKHAHGMTKRQIHEAIEKLQALKVHPRAEAANHLLVRRAERLEEELPLRLRNDLHDLLYGFEEAMEMRDEALIHQYHEALREFLDENDHADPTDGEHADDDW